MKVWCREATERVTARPIVGMPVPLRKSLTCCLETRKEQMGHVLLEQPGTVEKLFLALPLNKQMPLKKHWPQKMLLTLTFTGLSSC